MILLYKCWHLKKKKTIFICIFFSRQVEGRIVDLLNRRKLDCVRYEGHERHERCKEIFEQYEEANKNYFIKCEYIIYGLIIVSRKNIFYYPIYFFK